MDVIANDAGGGVRLYADASVWFLLAARYLGGRRSSADVNGLACCKGEEDKQLRYSTRDGARVHHCYEKSTEDVWE